MSFRIEPHAQPVPGYRLMERLGSGGFGEVWKTEAPGGIFKAIKFIHGDLRTKDNDLVRYAEQELKALNRVKTVRHPYLLSLDRIDIVDGRLMIIMELADCNLWDRFRHYRQQGQIGIPREELLRYMIESAEVLDLMNDQFNLQHLDIKPQNLFLLHHHVKVADFGQVKDLQGAAAEVTGGITPVYAAPETFEGYISKFCDQYSLACVYQELLTGVRPFDGTSLQQLLLQHVERQPNLDPSPFEDRVALSRALAKKPEKRFPSCLAFVQSLIQKAAPSVAYARPAKVAVGAAFPDSTTSSPIEVDYSAVGGDQASAPIAVELTGTPVGVLDTPFPPRPEDPPARLAPPEETGPGTLRPTVIVGLGGMGLRVLRRVRKTLIDQFGNPDACPLVRSVYVDTDGADIDAATTPLSPDGLPGLAAEDVFAARLFRPAHYLKPRLNGRTLTEGWFDTQQLYRLGRVPVTGGTRSFGRLAYCDNFRGLTTRLGTELATALDPLAADLTRRRTGRTLASNRPRVYVVGGLAGGTAGGMFLDLAYTLRAHLKFLGYHDPDIVGVFLLPPDGPAGAIDPTAQANVYAALTELNHYSRPESIFTANYDDRLGVVRDGGKPFRHVYLLPGPDEVVPGAPAAPSGAVANPARRSGINAMSGIIRQRTGMPARAAGTPGPNRSPEAADRTAAAAELIRLDLFTPVGRAAEGVRPPPGEDGPPVVRTTGFTRYYWPRGEVVNRTAAGLARIVLANWISADIKRARGVIPTWTADAWTRLGLDPDPLFARLAAAAGDSAATPLESLFESRVAPLRPKGWLSRGPDAAAIAGVLTQLTGFLGHPVAVGNPSPLEEAVCPVAVEIVDTVRAQLIETLPTLCDDPSLRLSGTEEAANQFVAGIDRLLARFVPQAEQLDFQARSSYERLMVGAPATRGYKSSPNDLAEAARLFASSRYQFVLTTEIISIYKHLRTTLTQFLADVTACRQRLQDELQKLLATAATAPPPLGPNGLLPPQCPTVAAAVETYTQSLTDEDLGLLESRVQSAVVDRDGGLFHACLNMTDGIGTLLDLLRDEARAYLDARLEGVDLVPMLASRFRTPEAARDALAAAAREAAPTLAGPGPWAKDEVTVVAAPSAPAARNLALAAIDADVTAVDAEDEIAYYREYPAVPLAALPQLGPAWEAAYLAACEVPQGSPHTRGDVPKWVPIDAG
jgi:hypothetical protein